MPESPDTDGPNGDMPSPPDGGPQSSPDTDGSRQTDSSDGKSSLTISSTPPAAAGPALSDVSGTEGDEPLPADTAAQNETADGSAALPDGQTLIMLGLCLLALSAAIAIGLFYKRN